MSPKEAEVNDEYDDDTIDLDDDEVDAPAAEVGIAATSNPPATPSDRSLDGQIADAESRGDWRSATTLKTRRAQQRAETGAATPAAVPAVPLTVAEMASRAQEAEAKGDWKTSTYWKSQAQQQHRREAGI